MLTERRMCSYLRTMKRLASLALLGTLAACGGRYRAGSAPEPQSPNAALEQFLAQLDQRAGRRFRMHEGAPPAWGPAPGLLVDQPVARRAAALQGAIEIGHAVANMMDAGAAAGEEFRHGAPGLARLEQLDVHVAEGQADDGRPVGGFRRAGSELQHVAVEGERFGDARHGDSDVRDTGARV